MQLNGIEESLRRGEVKNCWVISQSLIAGDCIGVGVNMSRIQMIRDEGKNQNEKWHTSFEKKAGKGKGCRQWNNTIIKDSA